MPFDVSSYWNSSPAITDFSKSFPSIGKGYSDIDWGKAVQWNPKSIGISPSTDVSPYWNPKGDTAGVPWGQALQWVPRLAGTAIDSYQKQLQQGAQKQQESDKKPAEFAAAPGAGWSSQQLLPNLSSLQYSGPTIQMAGVQGGDVPWYTKLGIGLGKTVLSAGLGALTGGLGAGAGAGAGAAGSAAGSAAFGAGGAAFNPAAFSMGSLI